MRLHDVLQSIYDAQASGAEMLATFQTLIREGEDKMTGVSRGKFEEAWKLCREYPAKFKLDIITARQNEIRQDVSEAMLKCDPPWEEVVEFCELIRGIQQAPHQLPTALDALAELKPELAAELRARAALEFPKQFPAEETAAE